VGQWFVTGTRLPREVLLNFKGAAIPYAFYNMEV